NSSNFKISAADLSLHSQSLLGPHRLKGKMNVGDVPVDVNFLLGVPAGRGAMPVDLKINLPAVGVESRFQGAFVTPGFKESFSIFEEMLGQKRKKIKFDRDLYQANGDLTVTVPSPRVSWTALKWPGINRLSTLFDQPLVFSTKLQANLDD